MFMDRFFFTVPQKAAILKGNQYLILKRTHNVHTYPNYWDFPGGRLEVGEDVNKGLEREVMEETSLKIKIIKPAFTFHEVLNGHGVCFIVYLCEKKSGEIKLSNEHTEYKWATKEEILELKIENFLKEYLRANE